MKNARMGIKLLFLLCACFMFLAGEAFSQRASTLVGTVSDSATNNPVPNVAILLSGTTLGTNSDSSGKYVLLHVPKGLQTLVFRHLAYSDVSRILVIPRDADTVVFNVSLSPTVLPLPGMTITGRTRIHESLRDTLYRRWARVVFTGKQIREDGIIELDQFIHWHVPLAENNFDLFVDGSPYPYSLRDVINMGEVKEILVWRRIDAPVEFLVMPPIDKDPFAPAPTRVLTDYKRKDYIVLIRIWD